MNKINTLKRSSKELRDKRAKINFSFFNWKLKTLSPKFSPLKGS